MHQHTDVLLCYWVSDDRVSAGSMPASESVMVYSSSQSVSSAESDSDSV